MNAVLFKLSKGLLILALTISLGAHWAFLQTVAWTGMIVTYAQQTTLSQAVALTFSGDKPCSLCDAIDQGKAQERQAEQETLCASKDLKLGLPLDTFELSRPRVEPLPAIAPSHLSVVASPPSPPPPRPSIA